jgi:antitoxin PrlF
MEIHYLEFMPAVLDNLEVEAALTAQDQITVPAAVRKTLNLRGGRSRVIFQFRPKEGVFVFKRAESASDSSEDPALRPFLSLLERDMQNHPDRLTRFPSGSLKKARALVKVVSVDLDGPLTGED